MRGIVSFHPVDVEIFDRLLGPLMAGDKVNPESFLEAANRARQACWHVQRYKRALRDLLALLETPPAQAEGTVWQRLRTRLERLDHRPDPTAALVEGKVDPDLHLRGRPFLICEGSTERVSDIVDEYRNTAGTGALDALVLEQLLRIHPRLGAELQPVDLVDPTAPLTYRNDLLADLRALHGGARSARQGASGAVESNLRELAWRALDLHGRVVPFWIGRDVDGLETVCRSAEVEPPGVLAPAWRPFAAAIDGLPGLRDVLTTELRHEKEVGGFVSPEDVPELIAFLNAEGARIIQAATRHGVGPTCTTLLRKIRECAHYARRHGMGYVEASGVLPIAFEVEEDAAEDRPV